MFNKKIRNIPKYKSFILFIFKVFFSCLNYIFSLFSLFAIVFTPESTQVNNWLLLSRRSNFNPEDFFKSMWYHHKIMSLFIYFKYTKHMEIKGLFAHFSGLCLTLISVAKMCYIRRNQCSVYI